MAEAPAPTLTLTTHGSRYKDEVVVATRGDGFVHAFPTEGDYPDTAQTIILTPGEAIELADSLNCAALCAAKERSQ